MHCRYARISQVYFYIATQKLVVRQSRRLIMYAKRIYDAPADAYLLLRWMANTPVGDTTYPPAEGELAKPKAEERDTDYHEVGAALVGPQDFAGGES